MLTRGAGTCPGRACTAAQAAAFISPVFSSVGSLSRACFPGFLCSICRTPHFIFQVNPGERAGAQASARQAVAMPGLTSGSVAYRTSASRSHTHRQAFQENSSRLHETPVRNSISLARQWQPSRLIRGLAEKMAGREKRLCHRLDYRIAPIRPRRRNYKVPDGNALGAVPVPTYADSAS
jgi:hypothetical protein